MLAFVVGVATGCASTQPQLERLAEHEARARVAAETGDWADAVEHWNAVRRIDPHRDAEVHLGLARALRALRRPRLALDALEDGLHAFPRDPDVRRARGHLLVELGFRRAAQADFEAVVRALPNDPLAWCDLAAARMQLLAPGAAADAFEHALVLDDCPAAATIAAARANHAAGRSRRAHELYARALARAPEDVLLLREAIDAAGAGLADRRAQIELGPDVRRWERRLVELDPVAGDRVVLGRGQRRELALAIVRELFALVVGVPLPESSTHSVQRTERRCADELAAGSTSAGPARRSRLGPFVE